MYLSLICANRKMKVGRQAGRKEQKKGRKEVEGSEKGRKFTIVSNVIGGF